MRYIPHTDEDVRRMLQAVGVARVDDLFETIPAEFRLRSPLKIPPALDEASLERHFAALAGKNRGAASRMAVFLGAGAPLHHLPAAVDQLLLRGEFFTAYTPYQPEVSQGTLQAIFEFQSQWAAVLGVEVVNASMYDGASATAEAVLMARRVQKKRSRTLLARALHPEVRATCQTYLGDCDCPLDEVPFGADGRTDLAALEKRLDASTAAVVIQQPNFLGCLEPVPEIAALAHRAGALLVVCCLEPVALGLIEAPGKQGADIVTGEGMGLAGGPGFGGPGLGLFGSFEKHLWQMPGRLVGRTRDGQGRIGYVLTLATREQHIRRARATSNICSNEGLCALASCIHLSLLGRAGFSELSRINAQNAREALRRFGGIAGVRRAFAAPFFNEFCLKIEGGVEKTLSRLREAGILGGLPLGRFYPELADHLLVSVTEINTAEQVDAYAKALAGK
ncbi:MAG: aminomethyl-transferring glycine dehydrogenase subunit GcvPA [Myxococcales bacterium]|nr:aminomethyl-transferring glycine dehydrogenase subunit GcvPA [Myxococcales bacterium]